MEISTTRSAETKLRNCLVRYSPGLFAHLPKSGKTTTASKFPRSAIFAFEKGFNALPGVMAHPVNSWGEFKKLIAELKEEEVKERFSTIVIDTVDICYNLCEKFICAREGVSKIGEIPFGQGYGMVAAEFDETIRKIIQSDYGLVLISHAAEKTITDSDGQEYQQICPTIDKKGRLICERMSDIIGYSTTVETENGKKTKLFLRGTKRFVAGSRFAKTPDSIDFSYDNLVSAIHQAIEEQSVENEGKYVSNDKTQVITKEVHYDFDNLMKTFQNLVSDLMTKNQSNAVKITEIVEKYLGKNKKVGDCTAEQAEQLDLIVYDLQKLI